MKAIEGEESTLRRRHWYGNLKYIFLNGQSRGAIYCALPIGRSTVKSFREDPQPLGIAVIDCDLEICIRPRDIIILRVSRQ